MKTLLRSTFRADQTEDPELLLRNAQALRNAGLSFDIPEDEVIWTWIQGFIDQYRHVPDASSIRGHFTTVNQLTIVDRLDSLSVERSKSQGDYLLLLEARAEDRRLRLTSEILREAGTIAVTGITVKEGKKDVHLRGPIHALRYVVDRASEVVTPTTGIKLSGDVTVDGAAFQQAYQRVEDDPLAGIGQLTGIQQLDVAIKGAKRKQLWTHAAFTGGLKSTFAVNWMYNQAIYYKHSSVLFSLEMAYEEVQRTLNAIHSAHPKFDAIRKSLGIKKCVEVEKIEDGELTPNEKEFLFKHVVPDLSDPANQYGGMHIEVRDPDKSDFTILDVRSKAELLFSKDPGIRMLILDHAGILEARHRHPNTT
jgi:DnaB-like helicase C terminal domain